MADDIPTPQPNGAAAADDMPVVQTLLQYVKDLSVEAPNSPQCFQWQVQPAVDVSFNMNVDKVADDVHEVVLKINVSAKSDQGTHFLVELSYAGLFGIRNVPDEAMGPFLLVEAPRLIFPFARQVVAESIQNAGFPPLLLEPIDFAAAFMQQVEAAQAEAGAGETAAAPVGEPSPSNS